MERGLGIGLRADLQRWIGVSVSVMGGARFVVLLHNGSARQVGVGDAAEVQGQVGAAVGVLPWVGDGVWQEEQRAEDVDRRRVGKVKVEVDLG
jgi:hypothetical protein